MTVTCGPGPDPDSNVNANPAKRIVSVCTCFNPSYGPSAGEIAFDDTNSNTDPHVWIPGRVFLPEKTFPPSSRRC